MNVGMLWFDNDAEIDFNTKVFRAARYYRDKYGRNPNLCYVHPSMVGKNRAENDEESTLRAGDIEIRITRSVLPNHLWIGVNSLNGNSHSS